MPQCNHRIIKFDLLAGGNTDERMRRTLEDLCHACVRRTISPKCFARKTSSIGVNDRQLLSLVDNVSRRQYETIGTNDHTRTRATTAFNANDSRPNLGKKGIQGRLKLLEVDLVR